MEGWHTLVQRFRSLQDILVLLVVNHKPIILRNELRARLRAVEAEVGHRVLRRIVVYRQVVLAESSAFLRGRGSFVVGGASRVGQQGNHAGCVGATFDEVPLVHGEFEVETQVKFVLVQKDGDVAHDCFV